jgi:hypothetical protein
MGRYRLVLAGAGAAVAVAILTVAVLAAPGRPNAIPVDLELVLAVDVSYSMDPDEQALQREGYATALTSKEFLQADAVAAEISAAPYRRGSRTSISGGLRFARKLFDNSGYRGLRRVIDVSGDGANNSGPLVVPMRDETVKMGITINGLPIMLKRPVPGTMDMEHLDMYYEDCVIGGPSAFVVPIRERAQFVEATREKLVLEVASRQPTPRLMPASAQAPRISCTIGETMWKDRWGGYDFH